MSGLLTSLQSGQELGELEIREFSDLLLSEEVPDSDKASLLQALTKKGETATEITHFVSCFLEKARKPDLSEAIADYPTIDVCGTGGDKLDLFNISTTSMSYAAVW